MARNHTSKFGVADELFEKRKNTQEVQEDMTNNTQQVQEVQEVITDNTQEVQEVLKEIGSTQGKKGIKLKRINMAFSDVNYEYITIESRRRGLSATKFVNEIINQYRNM